MSELHNPDNPEVVHEESDVNVGAILALRRRADRRAAIVHVFLWWLQGVYQRQTERAQTQAYPLAAGQQERLPPDAAAAGAPAAGACASCVRSSRRC